LDTEHTLKRFRKLLVLFNRFVTPSLLVINHHHISVDIFQSGFSRSARSR